MIAACMESRGYRHDDGAMADSRCVNNVDTISFVMREAARESTRTGQPASGLNKYLFLDLAHPAPWDTMTSISRHHALQKSAAAADQDIHLPRVHPNLENVAKMPAIVAFHPFALQVRTADHSEGIRFKYR